MDKLLPCPFCGGDAVKTWSHDYGDCAKCGNEECAASNFADRVMVSEWNTRHTPEGWQLVPVRPTDDMSQAGEDSYGNPHDCNGLDCEVIYEAMLAAAPKWGGE